MQVISGVNNSAFFAQSAYSAATATFDKNGNDIAETYYPTNNPSGFLTGVDLTPYQTKTDMTGYLTTAESANFYPSDNPSGFITGVDLSDYATTAELAGKQDAGDYLSASESANYYPMTGNPSGFLTEHQSLDGYLQDTDLTIVDNKITEISGVPLSAGDELPSGTMNTSALEYNAVNEISGYNGSAIAQYGAEKQWLVHDDTLVHASNSAQYALGVAIDNVARLMGVDETVLFEHNDAAANVSSADLSENLSAFSKVKIYYATISDHCYGCNEFEISAMGLTDAIQGFGNNGPVIKLVQFNIQDTNISVNRTIGIFFASFGTTPTYRVNHTDDMKAINKVVGIGRKS